MTIAFICISVVFVANVWFFWTLKRTLRAQKSPES
jgi:hypothetical protein